MTPQSERDQLRASLPPLTDIIRGSLLREFHDGCPCHPKGRYGPYWRLSIHQGGRTTMRQLKGRQLIAVRRAVKNYERWWNACLRIFELNTQIALSQEAP